MDSSRVFSLLLLVFFVCSCGRKDVKFEDIPVVQIDPGSAREAVFDQGCDSLFFVELLIPDSMVWGSVNILKSYGSHFFLLDVLRTMTITIFDVQGNLVSQLDRRGKGPGEYAWIYAFTYSSETHELIVNDRSKWYYFYKLPDLEHTRHIFENRAYKLSIESLGRHLITNSDDSDESGQFIGLELYDMNKGSYKSINVPRNNLSVETSSSRCFVASDRGVLYVHPYTWSTLYRITEKEVTPLYRFDFGSYAISENNWLDKSIVLELELRKNKAAIVRYPMLGPDKLRFAYLFKDIRTTHLAAHDRASGMTNIYSSFRFWDNGPVVPTPVGIFRDFFVSIVYPEYMDDLQLGTGASSTIRDLFVRMKRTNHPFLVLYRIQ